MPKRITQPLHQQRLSPGTLFEDYYRNTDAIRITENEARHFIQIGDREALEDLRRERAGEFALIGIRRRVETDLRNLRQQRNIVEGSRAPEAVKRRQLDHINQRVEHLMNRFNRLYNQRVE